ncbi:MAG: hypothetical protein ACPF8U_03205 [Flavobacteriales bacterium]
MNSFFSDDLTSRTFSSDDTADAAWVSPRPSSIANVLRYAQAFDGVKTSLGTAICLKN